MFQGAFKRIIIAYTFRFISKHLINALVNFWSSQQMLTFSFSAVRTELLIKTDFSLYFF